MNRSALAPAVTLIFCAVTATAAFAQSKPAAGTKPAPPPAASKPAPAAQTTQAPPARAKWVAPVKGIATVDLIIGQPKKVAGEIVTIIKVKNTSAGSIALFRVDEYWYNKSQQVVSGDTQRWAKPFLPGEIIEITLRSPVKPDLYQNQYNFAHANGQIKPNKVKAFK